MLTQDGRNYYTQKELMTILFHSFIIKRVIKVRNYNQIILKFPAILQFDELSFRFLAVSLESLNGGHIKSVSWSLDSNHRGTVLLVITHSKVKILTSCKSLHWHTMSGRHDVLRLLASQKLKLVSVHFLSNYKYLIIQILLTKTLSRGKKYIFTVSRRKCTSRSIR